METGPEKQQPNDRNPGSRNLDVQQTIDTRVRILVIAGRSAARNRLSQVLERLTNLAVCCEAEQPAEAVQIIEQSRVDLAVVDVSEPNKAGLKLMEQIRMRCPELPVLVVCPDRLPPDQGARQSGTAMLSSPVAQESDSIVDAVRYCQSLLRSGVSGFSIVFRI